MRTELSQLPAQFTTLKKLEELDLSDNLLSEVHRETRVHRILCLFTFSSCSQPNIPLERHVFPRIELARDEQPRATRSLQEPAQLLTTPPTVLFHNMFCHAVILAFIFLHGDQLPEAEEAESDGQSADHNTAVHTAEGHVRAARLPHRAQLGRDGELDAGQAANSGQRGYFLTVQLITWSSYLTLCGKNVPDGCRQLLARRRFFGYSNQK